MTPEQKQVLHAIVATTLKDATGFQDIAVAGMSEAVMTKLSPYLDAVVVDANVQAVGGTLLGIAEALQQDGDVAMAKRLRAQAQSITRRVYDIGVEAHQEAYGEDTPFPVPFFVDPVLR